MVKLPVWRKKISFAGTGSVGFPFKSFFTYYNNHFSHLFLKLSVILYWGWDFFFYSWVIQQSGGSEGGGDWWSCDSQCRQGGDNVLWVPASVAESTGPQQDFLGQLHWLHAGMLNLHIPGDGCMSTVGTSDRLPKFVLKDREFWQELASIK